MGDIKVLDLSENIAGPYCTRLLASWGAEVIKVEKPGEGDRARRAGPFLRDKPHPETSGLFLYLNTNKKSATLELNKATGTSILKRLVKDTDILVEGFRPGVMAGVGLDYDTLEGINPGLVMTSITAFGQDGPYRDYRASSMVEYAMGGQMWVCGQRDREPLNSAVPVGEYIAGLYAFIGTMLAVQHRQATGQGQHVDVSILECLAASHQFTLTWPEYSGALLERPGWPGSRAPLSFYACKDGYVNLRLQGIEMSLLAYLFDMPELTEDTRFHDLPTRALHIKELEAIVAEKLANLSKKDVFRTAGEWRALCGFVATPEDLLTDPHYQSRSYFTKVEHPITGEQTYPGAPVKMTESPWVMKRAPLLGEHNREVYCDRLGYTVEDLVRLRSTGII
jgi:crotonobetainyl-CoA:carnitine CoA-transferase CaiB-like acyl-CoA transferase